MLVSSFNLSQSFSYTPYLFYKKRFKTEINSFCIWTLVKVTTCQLNVCSPQRSNLPFHTPCSLNVCYFRLFKNDYKIHKLHA
jgi:hypothetical protein